MGNNQLRTEVFAQIPGFDNYEVSNYGRVINVKRGTDLKPTNDGAGYLKVALYRNGSRHEFGVHRLVAQAFFVDFDRDIEVYHIDKNKEDCSIRNLSLGKRLRIKVRIVETGHEFNSLQACAEHIGVESNAISQALSHVGHPRTVRGFHFEVVDR